MYESLGTATLKTGERVTLAVVMPPHGALARAARALLAHKSPLWQNHLEAALAGKADALETRFYLALAGRTPVANIMTVEYRGVGILGHVYTRPEHRRKGICTQLMARQMEHFRSRGGQCLVLGTGFETPPYRIYESFGFRSLRGGFMRYDAVDPAQFEARWFARGSAEIVPGRWEHWATAAILGATPDGTLLRSARWNVFRVGLLEHPYLAALSESRSGKGAAVRVLQTTTGAAVGVASVQAHGLWPGVWVVDAFTHPNFADRRRNLIEALPLPPGLCLAHTLPDDVAAIAGWEAAGFRRAGVTPGLLRVDGETSDVETLVREVPG